MNVASADLRFPLLLDVNSEALDLLIQGGQGNLETVGRIGLVPVCPGQHVDDNSFFKFLYNVKQRTPVNLLLCQ